MDKNQSTSERKSFDFHIDLVRVFVGILGNWYYILLSIIFSLSIAYYKSNQEQDVYPVSTSIIYLGKEEAVSGVDFLYKSSLSGSKRNYSNEPFLLRSELIVRGAVKEFDFTSSFYQTEQKALLEVYPGPVRVKHIAPSIGSGSYACYFSLIDALHYSLEKIDSDNKTVEKNTFLVGDTIVFDSHKMKIDLLEDREFALHFGRKYLLAIRGVNDVADEFIGKLVVRWAEEGAAILNISSTGSIPQKEIDFIQGLVEYYQSYDLEKKNQVASRASQFIKAQLDIISDSLLVIEKQLEQFKKNNSAGQDLDGEAKRYLTKLEQLDAKMLELNQSKNYYKYLEEYLATSNPLEQVILPSTLGLSDPVLNTLILSISELQIDLKLFVDREKSEGNPLFKSKLDRLNQLKRELRVAVSNLKSTDNLKVSFIKGQIEKAEKQMGYIPLAQRQFISIKRNYSLLENLFILLLTKKAESDIAKASAVSEFTYLNEPRVSGGSLKTSREKNLGIGFVIGLLMPIGFLVVKEFFNVKVQTKSDIERFTKIPIIGGIGHKRGKTVLEVLNSPSSVIAEGFRSLRSNLTYFTGKKNKVIFMVTSSISGEGKSFVAINLASLYAITFKKTLLVGADLRKPRLHKEFDVPNDIGLSSFLAGISDFDNIIQKTPNDLLDLVVSGPIPPNPSELLMSLNFKNFIEKAQKEYDCIIIDTPPIGIISDAFPIFDFVDHVIFLVRQKYTPKMRLGVIQDLYLTGKVKNISILFNDIYTGIGANYTDASYYAYGYGYKDKGEN
jgi:capsular exopolysaccharide synthesis family protein